MPGQPESCGSGSADRLLVRPLDLIIRGPGRELQVSPGVPNQQSQTMPLTLPALTLPALTDHFVVSSRAKAAILREFSQRPGAEDECIRFHFSLKGEAWEFWLYLQDGELRFHNWLIGPIGHVCPLPLGAAITSARPI